MVDSALQAVLNRIEAGEDLSQRDWQVLKMAVRSRQVTIQGSADRTVIVTGDGNVVGDRNIVISGVDAKTLQTLLGERDRNLMILLQAVKEEIQSRLDQSLHNTVLIDLGKEAQSHQVHRPWDAEVKIGPKPSEPLPPGISILDVFRRPDVAEKLLILGEPGSGKTTTMLDLAQALTEKAETDPNYPIPVLLNLSAWKDTRQQMKDWLIAELKSKYELRPDIGRKWIEEKQLLPLLDGLDEVRPDLQPSCVCAVNQLLSGECRPAYVVVCSRQEEYKSYPEKLGLNGAIHLQKLRNDQIELYLLQMNRNDLWQFLNINAELLELVRQPLLLNITLIAYSKELTKSCQKIQATEKPLKFLLDSYIEQMLHRKSQSTKMLTSERTHQHLVELARQLQRESNTEFLIENIQSYWISNKNLRRAYRISISLVVGLFILSAFQLFFTMLNLLVKQVPLYPELIELPSEFSQNIQTDMTFPITKVEKIVCDDTSFSIVANSYKEFIEESIKIDTVCSNRKFVGSIKNIRKTIEVLRWIPTVYAMFQSIQNSQIKAFEKLNWSRLSFVWGISYALGFGLLVNALNGKCIGIIVGFCLFVIATLSKSTTKTVEASIRANQGIRASAINAASILLGTTFSIGTIILVGSILCTGKFNSLALVGFVLCILPSSLISWKFGGEAAIRHIVLRFLLWYSSSIPWNYERFLDHATERMLLQRVGGRYRFIHRLLQEHFAAMPLRRQEDEG